MFRKLLLPFSFVYSLVLRMRHYLYDNQILNTKRFEFPVIAIGNLSLGGTGKTPHTIYVAGILENNYKVGILSRGYGRTSNGYFEVNKNSTPEICGDEPLLIKENLMHSLVAVCEKRVYGIEKMLHASKNLQVAILDDALQHRALDPGFKILLIDYSSLESFQVVLPAGNLRDLWSRRKNADILIITKCPDSINADAIKKKLDLHQKQYVFLSRYIYKSIISINKEKTGALTLLKERNILLITGIASASHLINELKKSVKSVKHLSFPDHYRYTLSDVKKIRAEIYSQSSDFLIITTEKDAVKLRNLLSYKEKNDWFYIKIEVAIDNSVLFEKLILEYVNKDSRNSRIY